jgi:hypothetical protein
MTMADSAFKTQVSRDENANSASNVMFIQIADDAGNVAGVTSSALDVNATVTLETAYVDDSAFTIGTDKVNAQGFLADETATDSVDEGDIGLARMTLDRRMITSSEQSGTWNIGTVTTLTGITNDVNIADGGNVISIDDAGGSITVDGSVTVSATDLDIRDIVHTQDSIALGDGTSILVDVLDGTIDALQVAITDGTDQLGINADGSINVVVAGSSGTKVHDYDTATPGAGASDNHDYTVVGTTFELSRVEWAGSGKMKVEVQSGPLASLATVAVGFTEKDSKNYIEFDPVLVVPSTSTGTVRVIRTNRQGAAVDVYSTIMGNDIA